MFAKDPAEADAAKHTPPVEFCELQCLAACTNLYARLALSGADTLVPKPRYSMRELNFSLRPAFIGPPRVVPGRADLPAFLFGGKVRQVTRPISIRQALHSNNGRCVRRNESHLSTHFLAAENSGISSRRVGNQERSELTEYYRSD